jgi:hypothetical protein
MEGLMGLRVDLEAVGKRQKAIFSFRSRTPTAWAVTFSQSLEIIFLILRERSPGRCLKIAECWI